MGRRNKKRKTEHEEVNSNGLLLGKHYLPHELLMKILSQVNCKTLLLCQLVCKHWKSVIQHFVWHKKAELTINRALNYEKKLSWTAYYCVCVGMPFEKNLIKNPSGEKGIAFWSVPLIFGNKWTINKKTTNVLLDKISGNTEETNFCFITSCNQSWKYQIVDLVKEGFSKNLLDNYQPTIKVKEWYYCKEAPVLYACDIELRKDNNSKRTVPYLESGFQTAKLIQYTFSKVIQKQDENKWLKFEMEFKNYGKGLRTIKFTHGGKDKHHYTEGAFFTSCCKMTKACVQVDLPIQSSNNPGI